MRRLALFALFALLAPSTALAWDDADMCAPLMEMVADAPNVFENLRGEETRIKGLIPDSSFASTAELPGSRACTIGLYGGVTQDMSLTCTYGTKSEKASTKLLERLAAAGGACVPEDWSESRGEEKRAQTVTAQLQAPGGMDATSVTVIRRRVDTSKYEVEIRIQAF